SGNVTGSGGGNTIGGFVGFNVGVIDPSTSSGAVTTGPDSAAGSFAGMNGQFVNFKPGMVAGTFPVGTICAGCEGSGQVNGSTGPQIGVNNPRSDQAKPPTANLGGCDQTICFILVNGQFPSPNDNNGPSPPPPDWRVVTPPIDQPNNN